MSWISRLYDRRIVNVNVNVIVAGVLALLITVAVMHLANRWGIIDRLDDFAPDLRFALLGYKFEIVGHKLVISGMTFIVDLVADVGVYYGLHWLANHMPRKRERRVNPAYADLSFIRDATLVQFERAVLSPLLYVVALGLQNRLLHQGYSVELATAYGFGTGIVLTRLIHTLWMIHRERRAGLQSAADIVGPDTAKPNRP